uniref:shikimate dehydrogenase (NADP(+)) n=1 Tax=Wollemia nobilis TaxID=56998 RepID=A0A0C9QS28_9CONI
MAQNGFLVCSPVMGETVEQMLSQIQLAKECGADCVELRLDCLNGFNAASDLEKLLKGRVLPAIVTCRLKSEGGNYEGDEQKRLNTLTLAYDLGADFVDVDLQAVSSFVIRRSQKNSPCKIIVSSYINGRTPSPEDLSHLVAKMQSTGADILKIVTTATNITDVSRIFQLIPHSQVPIIACATGDRGLISQLLGPKFGGYLIYGSIGSGKDLTPGQPKLVDLTNIYKIDRLSSDTKVFGVIANPVGHSKGPILHNQAFRETEYDGVYVPLLVDDLAEFLRVYSAPDFAGFSVGIPHKEAAVKCCNEVQPLAQSIGAVNTIVRRQGDGKLIGYNTDCEGAISAIEDGLRGEIGYQSSGNSSPLDGKLFVLIGAGGAGRALAFGAKQRGARVVIANRNFERAKALASAVGAEAICMEEVDSFHPETGMVLANTSAIGMQPNVNATPLSKESLGPYSLVFDAVYTPRETRLLREAKEAGKTVVSGLEMFIRQAIGQYELFTGNPAPAELMRKIVVRDF